MFFANTDWYLYNFRLGLAQYLRDVHGHEVILVSPPGAFGPRFESLNFRWIPVRMDRRSLNPIEGFFTLLRIWRIYRELRPDVAHHFTIKCSIYGAIISWIARVPIAVHAITGLGSIFTSKKKQPLRPFVNILMRSTMGHNNMHVIVQNPDDREVMLGILGPSRAKISLIRGSGVDTKRFSPRQSMASSPPVSFLFVGRLISDKGIREFCEAARRLHRLLPEVQYFVAGTIDLGNPGSLTENEIASLRSEGIFRFLGHVEDVANLLQQVSAVVLPSTYGEGVPRSLIEAAAAGLPLIATDSAGCREIVENNLTGILVAPNDIAQLTEAMRRLATDSELRTQMGTAGRAKVILEFSEEIVFERTYEVYQQASSDPDFQAATSIL